MCKGSDILLGCHQSPDGLAVVNSEVFKKHVFIGDLVRPEVLDKEYLTVLFEQKSPYYRNIVPNTVPEHYVG